MSFTKYASMEDVRVLEVRSAPERARHASLGRLSDFHEYRTQDGYLYARIRAISSRVNKNHDGWPAIELAGGQDIFDRHTSSSDGLTVFADSARKHGFSTFLGKPIFVDHHNSDPKRARGAIVDSTLHIDDHRTASRDPYYSSSDVDPEHLPGTWVELLLEVDSKAFPKFAKAIVEGSRNPSKGIDGWSMGCDVAHSVCSICKNSAVSPEDYCKHIRMKGAYFDYTDPQSGHKTSKRAYENCYGISFFEISGVFDPADATALSLERITASLKDEADEQEEELLEESEREELKRKKRSSNEIACPNCAGMPGDAQCPMCRGNGVLQAPMPGGDGYVTPSSAEFGHGLQEAGAIVPDGSLGPARHGHVKHADNPLPQAELSHAPEHVDTLREEEICPVCGSSMDEDTCDVCGYQEPPDGFGNPDLTKAKDVDVPTEPMDDPRMDAPNVDPNEGATPPPEAANTPMNPTALSHVTHDMSWDVHERTAARINKIERPLVDSDKPQTNEPQEQILSDQLRPVTSHVRTAEDFIAAAGATRRTTMNHTAEAASGAPAVAKPDVHTDVTGVGGVDQASNEAASKADAQVDVTGIGSTGVDSVSADKKGVNVEQGDEHSKNIEAIPTKTWADGEGDSLGQHDPVTSEPFPASEDGVHATSSWVVEGHDDGVFPADAGIGGGTAVKGVKPHSETFGDRVNVLEHITSPSNNSGPTTTWSGTDGNGVLKQQDPVTNDSIARGESGLEGAPNWTSSTHIFTAFKLADLEVELGLTAADKKYARAAELEQETPAVLAASLTYAQRVKTAAVRKAAGVQRLPVMGRPNTAEGATKEASTGTSKVNEDDEFMFGGV